MALRVLIVGFLEHAQPCASAVRVRVLSLADCARVSQLSGHLRKSSHSSSIRAS